MAAGGAPPMDPSMAPPMDPAMMAPPMDPAMMAPPPMDPAAMGAPPMDPGMGAPAPGTPVTLTLEDLQAVVAEMVPAKEEETGRVTNRDLGASVEALSATMNAIATSLGVQPVAPAEDVPAEAAAMEGAPVAGPEEAALAEQMALAEGGGAMPPMDPATGMPMDPAMMAPPMDPAMMEAAAAQGMPMPGAPPMPGPAPMMQMTAEEYTNGTKPDKNRVAHMLLNLRTRR
jgi:hypothetical protein